MNTLKVILAKVRLYATEYEPARAAAVVAAVFQVLAVLGVSVGDLPAYADKVLTVLAVLATLIAGNAVRKRVTAPATLKRERLARRNDA